VARIIASLGQVHLHHGAVLVALLLATTVIEELCRLRMVGGRTLVGIFAVFSVESVDGGGLVDANGHGVSQFGIKPRYVFV